MPEFTDPRRKRLFYLANHRGMKENDVVLGGFARDRMDTLDDDQLDRFETLMQELDIDILNWVTGKEPVPEHLDTDVYRMILDYKNAR